MRLLIGCLVAIAIASARPVEAQWRTPSGVVVTRTEGRAAETVDVVRPQRITWIDLSSGLLGALIGVLIATTLCDDDSERNCPTGVPVIGGALGAAIGVAVGRATNDLRIRQY